MGVPNQSCHQKINKQADFAEPQKSDFKVKLYSTDSQ